MIKYTAIFSLCFLITLSALASAKVNTKICRKKNGLFPKPGSLCKAYYKCTNYVPFEFLCPPEHHFSTTKLRCDWMDLFPCFEKPKREECPKADGKFLKPGTGCIYYYDCCNGEPTEKKCPVGHLFDPSKGGCEWKERYTCVENISTEGPMTSVLVTTSRITESTLNEITPSTTEINELTSEEVEYSTTEINESTPEEVEYSTTSIEESTPKELEESTTLDCETTFEESTTVIIETETTIFEEVSLSTENGQITNEPNIMCPEPFGYYPHPTDKHKFVGCVDNIPTVLTCPSDLVYDHEHRQCVYE